ncbi:unnamed protein product [Caretta caretta]
MEFNLGPGQQTWSHYKVMISHTSKLAQDRFAPENGFIQPGMVIAPKQCPLESGSGQIRAQCQSYSGDCSPAQIGYLLGERQLECLTIYLMGHEHLLLNDTIPGLDKSTGMGSRIKRLSNWPIRTMSVLAKTQIHREGEPKDNGEDLAMKIAQSEMQVAETG